MADILLSAGLDTGSINAAQFQKDLKTALAGVEIPKVGVGIEVSKESIAVFRSQLQRIVNSITLDSGSLIRIDVGDLGSVTTKIDKASDSLERLSRAAKNTKMSDLGVDKIVGAQTAIDKLITKLEKLRSTKPGGDLGKNIESQLAALRALRDGLAGMGAMDYAKEYQYAKTAIDALVTSQQRLNAEAMNTPLVQNTKEYNDALAQAVTLLRQVQDGMKNWTAARSGVSAQSYGNLSGYAEELQYIINNLDKLDRTDVSARLARIGSGFKADAATIRSAGEATDSFLGKLKGIPGALLKVVGIQRIFSMVVRGIRSMVNTVIELDSAMTNLQIVTGATDTEMVSFMRSATQLAKDLGKSISDVTGSIEVFSRLGYSLDDASELTKYATIMSNVAAVGTDEATTGLTAIIKGYNMDVSNAEHVADVLVEVGQKYAVSAGELMSAFERSGAALSASGTSFEKSAGLIAAANAAVQNSNTVGVALKTVSARIRGAKTDLDELGEDTSDLAEGFSKYANELQALTGFDIRVEGTTDTYKDLYDIFEGISGVWERLSDTQQARVAEILGGTRQLQVISSILKNWSDATNAYADAMDSAGVATKANDQYMESIQGHIGQLKASWQELASSTFSRDAMNQIIDFTRSFVEMLNPVAESISKIGAAKVALAGLSAISFVKLSGGIGNARDNLAAFGSFLKDMPGRFQAIKSQGAGTFKAISNAIFGSTTALSTFLGIAAAIAAIWAVDKFVFRFDDITEEAENASAAFEEQRAKVESINSELETLGERIDALSAKGSLTLTEAAELDRLRDQTAELEKQLEFEKQIAAVQGRDAAEKVKERLSNNGLVYNRENHVLQELDLGEAAKISGSMLAAIIGLSGGGVYASNSLQADMAGGINELVTEYESLIQKRDELNKQIVDLDPDVDIEKYKEVQRSVSEVGTDIEEVEAQLAYWMPELKSDYTTLIDAGETGDYVDFCEDIIERFNAASSAAEGLTDAEQAAAERQKNIDKVLSTKYLSDDVAAVQQVSKELNGLNEADFADTLNDFPELAKAIAKACGMSEKEISDLSEQFDGELGTGLVQAMQGGTEEAQAIFNGFIDTINSNAGTVNYDALRQQFIDSYSGLTPEGVSRDWGDWNEFLSIVDEMSGEEIEMFLSFGYDVASMTPDEIRAALQDIRKEASAVDMSLEGASEQVGEFTGKLDSLRSALNDQTATGTVSFDVFSAEEMQDFAGALEQVNDGYQYNIEAVNDIVAAKAEELKYDTEIKKANAQAEYVKRAKEIQKLRDEYDSLGDSKEDDIRREQILADIASKRSENASVYRDIQGFRVLSAQIDQTTSAYQQWQNAQNATNSGQMFSDVSTAFGRINDVLRNEDSDLFRQIGNKQYQADLAFILPDKEMTEEQITSWWDDFSRFFVFTEEGAIDDLNIPQFADEAVQAGLMNFSEQDGWTVAAGKSLDDFAAHFGTTREVMQSFFDYWNLYLDQDHQFTWTDEVDRSFGDLMVDAQEAVESITSQFDTLPDGKDIKLNLDVDGIEDKDQALAVLQQNIDQMNALKPTLEVDSTEMRQANDIIRASVAEMQMLTAPVVMNVNTANFTGPLSEAVATLQEWQNAQWNLEQAIAIGADDSEVQAAREQVESLTEEVQALDLESVGLDVDVTDTESIQESLDNLDLEVLAKIIPDDSWFDAPEEGENVIDYIAHLDSSEVDEYINSSHVGDGTIRFSAYHRAVDAYIASLKNLNYTVTYTVQTQGSAPSSSSTTGTKKPSTWNRASGATRVLGTARAGGSWSDNRGGKTLVGELGREIVVDPRTGRWYTVGDKGAEFVYIPKGSIVFNHKQSEDLLRDGNTLGRAIAVSKARALAAGTAMLQGGTGGSFNMDAFKKRIEGGYTASGSNLNTSSSSNRVSGNQKASGEEDNWFERMYAYHNHLINMEQETVEEYLKWLDGAYQQAYNEQIIELEDYYQYQEEVFEKLRELYQDSLDDIEHTIEMLQHYQGTAPQIIEYYRSMMASIQQEIMAARAAGLTDNDEYIQELQDRWWTYHDGIVEIEETTIDDAEDALDELVRFRMDMLKKDYEAEKDNLNDRLDNLKDFYDKQKELLDDQADEEDYLKEQAERRKKVSDLENELARLELDNSAWAQKRKLELREQLMEAREDLDEFERDHALQMAKDQLDAQYEMQAGAINDELAALEEKLASERALYDQALEDIRNDNGTLMQEMIEWNAQYGSFIDRDVTQMWDAASKALQNYKALYDEWYLDVQMKEQTASQSSAPSAGASWSDNPVSGDYYEANKPATPTPPPSQPSTPSGGSSESSTPAVSLPYGYVEDYSGNIQYGHTGNKVKAVQNALNKLGYGNSGTNGLDGIFGVNTRAAVYNFQRANGLVVDGIVGVKTKAAFKKQGYGFGTPKALPGFREVEEFGPEYTFTSADGNKYRVFSGGEKVLNAKATDFLYKFANSGGSALKDMIAGAMRSIAAMNTSTENNGPQIQLGNIIIEGSADKKTVSQIRRAQKEEAEYILTRFKQWK